MNAMAADNTETAVNTDITDTANAADNVAATTINAAVDAASDANTADAMTINADEDTHADVPTEHKEPDDEDKGEDQHEEEEKNATNNKKSMEVSRPQSISLFGTDGRAKAVSLAGATEIDMAAHEYWMVNVEK